MIRRWSLASPGCSAPSPRVRIMLTLPMGGSPFSRCDPTSRSTFRANSWATSPLIGFVVMGTAHARFVTASSASGSKGGAPLVFTRWPPLAAVPLPPAALLLTGHPAFGMCSPVVSGYGRRYRPLHALTLPALVLVAPSRGGRRHTLRIDNDTRRRCLDWVNGIRADLWSPHHDKRGKPRKGPSTVDGTEVLPDAVVSRVATLLKDGALRRACAALLQEPPISPTGDVVTALRDLHPAPGDSDRAGMQSLRQVASRAAPVVDVDGVRKAVQSFPSTSGAGKSGLRPSHIRDATRPASSDLLFRLITEVVNLLLQGEVPESVRPFVCGASIMALRKPNGTLRPIAVGETLRRITGKVAVELISERALALLEPVQLGVKTPNCCEAIVHATRQWFHRHRSVPTKTAVSVDISNAFNTVNRSAVLRSVRTHFPSLAPWVDCCYRHDSYLFTGSSSASDRTIPSSRGVQQGDPLGRCCLY